MPAPDRGITWISSVQQVVITQQGVTEHGGQVFQCNGRGQLQRLGQLFRSLEEVHHHPLHLLHSQDLNLEPIG